MESSTVAASNQSTGSATIADMLGLAAERFGDRPAVRYKRDGAWHDVSFAQLGEIVSEIARGLIDLGLEPGDRVSLLCSTRPEWTYVDFAITSAGGVVASRSARGGRAGGGRGLPPPPPAPPPRGGGGGAPHTGPPLFFVCEY